MGLDLIDEPGLRMDELLDAEVSVGWQASNVSATSPALIAEAAALFSAASSLRSGLHPPSPPPP